MMYRRKRRKQKRHLPKIVVLAMLAIIGVFVFVRASGGGCEYTSVNSALSTAFRLRSREQADVESDTMGEVPIVLPPGFPAFTTQISTTDIMDTQYLTLVNREHALTSPVNHAHLVTAWPNIPARDSEVMLHKTAFSAIQDLFSAAERANIHSFFVACGFRSHDMQNYLYTTMVDTAYVMPPGHSEHQLGLAADILTSAHDFQDIRGTQEARWLAENAPQFGLILRYPENKQEITGVPYEPWHFRYIGRIHAWYMGRQNFVLEEYIEYLQRNDGFRAEFDGKSYYVLYQRPENGILFVPVYLDFTVSRANTGGYIVTTWR